MLLQEEGIADELPLAISFMPKLEHIVVVENLDDSNYRDFQCLPYKVQ
jgi:hypothetical protein